VPVRAGEQVLGFIRTGQVFVRPPNSKKFAGALRRLTRWGIAQGTAKLREAYFTTRLVPPKKYRSAIGLLKLLAQHLSHMSNQLVLQRTRTEVPTIALARQFIAANYAEPIRLRHVAEAVRISTFYFCKQFKKTTGINFSTYLARFRVEKAKGLLLNPHRRVSEVGFDAGFESLGNFNRMFKRIVGLNPTNYRASLGIFGNHPLPGRVLTRQRITPPTINGVSHPTRPLKSQNRTARPKDRLSQVGAPKFNGKNPLPIAVPISTGNSHAPAQLNRLRSG
jgi:AraC-like DNA-binding protein